VSRHCNSDVDAVGIEDADTSDSMLDDGCGELAPLSAIDWP